MTKEETIRQLGKQMGITPNTIQKKKYFESTQTLYQEGKIINPDNKKRILEFPLDENEYQKIFNKNRCYLITREQCFVGDEIQIYEINGLKRTGRNVYKTVLDVREEKDEPGLKKGYYLITY